MMCANCHKNIYPDGVYATYQDAYYHLNCIREAVDWDWDDDYEDDECPESPWTS